MSKSYRNQLVEWAYKLLLALTDKEKCNEHFSGNDAGWSLVAMEGGGETIVSSVNPVMTVRCSLPLRDLVSVLGPDVENVEGQKNILCSGYSKLKPGDEWSGYEGYKICCKRAARDFAEKILAPVDDRMHESLCTILIEEEARKELNEAFYLGNFSNLGLIEDGADEEE